MCVCGGKSLNHPLAADSGKNVEIHKVKIQTYCVLDTGSGAEACRVLSCAKFSRFLSALSNSSPDLWRSLLARNED